MKILLNPSVLTCQITIGDWRPVKGVQKLIGFSRGWHHWNSIRLGYNRSENKDFVRLFNYAYFKGENLQKHIGDFFVGDKLDVQLLFNDKTIAAMVKRQHESVYSYNANFYRPNNIWFPIGYQLNSYAEQDHTGAKLPLEVDIKDLIIR